MKVKGPGLVGILLFAAFLTAASTQAPVRATDQYKVNGLTIALDTLRSSDTPQVLIDFMKRYHYNGLRIYMGWCSSFWTGDVNSPMDARTQNFIDELCRLCAENNFMVVCAVSDQVTPFKTAFPQEIQVGPYGEQNSQGNWVCPTGPNFQTFTKQLIKILVRIMEKYSTPRISVDEVVFVTGGGKPTFYSQSMKTAYLQATGKSVPIFTSTSGSYNTEQRQFIEFAKNTIREFYEMMEATARAEDPNVLFGALVDTYWVYPKTSYDTQPWDYYATVDEIVYEWFYAIQNQNWSGITDGLRRIKNLNPTANHFFIYGTSTMTTITNMRKSVELAMAEDYDGVFLYEYAKSKNNPFDVSDLVPTGPIQPTPPPSPLEYWNLNIASTEGGTTSPSGTVEVSEDRDISVTANADSGWELSHWQFDGKNVGDANPKTIPAQDVGTSHDLVAVFTRLPSTHVMHVESIHMSKYGRRYVRCEAVVTIVDSDGDPVEGAKVSGIWSGITSREQSKTTRTNGKVTFYSYRIRRRWSSGTVIFTVNDVVKTGWTYDPLANEETRDSILI